MRCPKGSTFCAWAMMEIIQAQGIKTRNAKNVGISKRNIIFFNPFFRVCKNTLESSSKQIKNRNICFYPESGCWGRAQATNRFNMHQTWHKSSWITQNIWGRACVQFTRAMIISAGIIQPQCKFIAAYSCKSAHSSSYLHLLPCSWIRYWFCAIVSCRATTIIKNWWECLLNWIMSIYYTKGWPIPPTFSHSVNIAAKKQKAGVYENDYYENFVHIFQRAYLTEWFQSIAAIKCVSKK